MRQNVAVGIRYLAAWLAGSGCVPLFHLMEDAATAEISRAQLWQWLRHGARLKGGHLIDSKLFKRILWEEMTTIREEADGDASAAARNQLAGELFEAMVESTDFEEFLTLPAYQDILSFKAGQ